MAATTPEVTWAQRSSASTAEKNIVYLTIVAPDVPTSKAKIDLQPTHVEFTGASATKKTTYHIKLDFFAEIDVKESKIHHSDRDVAFVLRKKNHKDEYWPRLTKKAERLHFLKTDFDKWVDEDEQDALEDENMVGGMGGMGADGGFGGIDFSKLGGGGMPDLGNMGGDDEGEEDDEDMPDLEDEKSGEEEAAASGSSKPKIQEVS